MAQNQGSPITAIVPEMAKHPRPRRVTFAGSGKSNAQGQWADCSSDFSDAIRGMPDRKTRLADTKCSIHRQCRLFKAILLAIEVGQTIIHVHHRTAGISKCLSKCLDHPVGAKWLFRLDRCRLVTRADADADEIVSV